MSISPLPIAYDVSPARGTEVGLRPPHEWQTPWDELSIFVYENGHAHVCVDYRADEQRFFDVWNAAKAKVEPTIKSLRGALDRFRAEWSDYLDDIDPQDMAGRLQQFIQQYDWDQLNYRVDSAYQSAWDRVAVSPELRELAVYGYRLYETFFPPTSEVRPWLDCLPAGGRLNITWWDRFPGWVPHVPWGLMYQVPPPLPGAPVDAMRFLGLRYRIAYEGYESKWPSSKALGDPAIAHRGHVLYWSGPATDPTLVEATWQRAVWSSFPGHVCVPIVPVGAAPKAELMKFLQDPGPPPMPVVYLFCQCGSDAEERPVLYFGATSDPLHSLGDPEIAQDPLRDRPFVFINACSTSAAHDPSVANPLEWVFFLRGCRAYLGTVAKVPIRLASRFAFLFFHFFGRLVVPEPMAAGEAATQARLFLWTEYKNIGGLFYTYTNQYSLFMASEAEVRTMLRRP